MAEGADISELLKGLDEGMRLQLEVAQRATTQYAAHVSGDSQENCPIDTGALAASHTWEEAELDGDFIVAEIGANVDYAAAVHERWMQGGPRSKNGNPLAIPKFMEMALRTNAPKFGPFVADQVKAATERNGGGPEVTGE